MIFEAEKEPGERWKELVTRGIESETLDYKSPMDWNELTHAQRAKLVRHATAFANTRGGCIVIGVREDEAGRPILYEGLSAQASRSFDPSTVGMFFNSCVEPPIDFTIERPTVNGKRYVIMVIRPFAGLPHVCSRAVTGELQQGVFYIRTQSASSRPAYRAGELHSLIQRALRNQREELGRMLRGILFESGVAEEQDGAAAFRSEVQSSMIYFRRRQKDILQELRPGQLLLSFTAHPAKFLADRFPLSALSNAALAMVSSGGEFVTAEEFRQSYNANTALRYFSAERGRMWQLFRSGQLHWMGLYEDDGQQIPAAALYRFAAEALAFAGRYYGELGLSDAVIDLELFLFGAENWQLVVPGVRQKCCCRIPEVELHFQRSAATLAAGGRQEVDAFVRELADRFNVPAGATLTDGGAAK